MAFKREDRVADEIKRIVADLIAKELDDPRVPAFTSVTEVTVSRDFNYADLYISVLAADRESQERAVQALNNARGFLRTLLSKRLDLRVTPELRFHLDDSYDKGQRIDDLLEQVKQAKSDPGSSDSETKVEPVDSAADKNVGNAAGSQKSPDADSADSPAAK